MDYPMKWLSVEWEHPIIYMGTSITEHPHDEDLSIGTGTSNPWPKESKLGKSVGKKMSFLPPHVWWKNTTKQNMVMTGGWFIIVLTT